MIYSPTDASSALLLLPCWRAARCCHGALPSCPPTERTPRPQEVWDGVEVKHMGSSRWLWQRGSSSRPDEEPTAESPGEYQHRSASLPSTVINYSTWENFVSGKHDIRVQLGE